MKRRTMKKREARHLRELRLEVRRWSGMHDWYSHVAECKELLAMRPEEFRREFGGNDG